MKRRFISFLSAVVVAFMSFAQTSGTVVYSWESPEGTVIESGGTIAYVLGDGERLNYGQAGYHTICLNGKKANLVDETASQNAGRMVITLNEALQEGDSIYVTGFRNKDADGKTATIYFVYENGTVVADDKAYCNIRSDDNNADYDNDGSEPTTHGYLVPVEAVGSKTITLTRNSSGTNLFITKFVIVRLAAEDDTLKTDYTDAIANADLSISYAEGATSADWDITNTKGISGGMTKVGSGKTFDFNQTITLPAGQYKMTAQAAYRYSGGEQSEYDAIKDGTETHLVKLYAETASKKYEANVQNRYEGASETDYAAGSGSVTVNNLFVPNSSSAVQTWFNNGKYVNELVFNVLEDGQVKIGITRVGTPDVGDYTNIGAWTLTRLGDAVEEEPETPAGPVVYTMVQDAADLVAGEKYLIMSEVNGGWVALSDLSGKIRVPSDTMAVSESYTVETRVASAVAESLAICAGAAYALTLEGEAGAWKFKDELNGAYLHWSSGNYLVNDATGSAWSIEFNKYAHNAVITHAVTTDRVLQYNASSPRFCAYTSSQAPVYLFKAGEVTVAPVAPSNPSFSTIAEVLAFDDGYVIELALNKAKITYCSGKNMSITDGVDTLNIYDYNIPADYTVGAWLNGTLVGKTDTYKGNKQLANIDWSEVTFTAPVTVESPWVGAVAETGVTYYLYNPAAKAFLKAGNSWGTRSSFGDDAYPVSLEGSDGVYAISTTLTFSGCYLRASDLFMDQKAKDGYAFEEVGEGIYTFSNAGKYVAYTGVNTLEYTTELGAGCYWQLLTAEAIKEQMLAADAATPYAVTALITCANFGRNDVSVSAWTGSPSAGGDNDNFCAEKWNAGISVVSQTLTGLPNGTYKLQAQGLYRMGGVDAAVALRDAGTENYDVKFFANDDSVLVMSVMDEAGKLSGVGDAYGSYGAAPNNRNHASKFFNAGYYEHELYFTVTEGTAVIGVANNTGAGADWLVFDNFRLTYYGNATVEEIELAKLQAYIDELTALVNEAKAVEATYSDDAKANLDAAVAVGEAALATPTQDGLIAAVAPLEAAIARATRSVAINAVAGTASLTAPVDFTKFVVNPDMETGDISGWTTSAKWQFQNNNSFTNGEAVINNKFQERWENGTALGNTSTKQVLTDMPNGVYRITASIIATAQYKKGEEKSYVTGAYLFANSDSIAIATENNKPELFTVDAIVANNELTIGIEGVNTTANWLAFDNVTVQYYGAEPEAEWIDITAERMVNGDLSSETGWTSAGVDDHYAEKCKFLAFYAGWGSLETPTAASLKQDVTLPAGEYRLTGKAFFRQGEAYSTNPTKSLGYMVAGENKVLVKTLGSVEGLSAYANKAEEGATAFYTNDLYTNVLEFTLAEETTLSIGYECDFDEMRSWMGIGSMKLEKKYTIKDRFMEVKADLEMLTETCTSMYALGAVNTGYMAVLDQAYAVASDIENASILAMNELIPVMVDKIAEVKAIDEYYLTKFTSVNDLCNEILENSTPNTQEAFNAFDEVCALAGFMNLYSNVATLDQLQTLADTLESARRIYVVNAAPVDGYSFDYTFLIEGVGNSKSGWTWTPEDKSWAGNFQYQNNNGADSETLKKQGYVEVWSQDAAKAYGLLSYEASVPNGYYTISAYTFTNGTTSFVANDKAVAIENTGKYVISTLDSVMVSNGKIAFGLKNAGAAWVGITNIELNLTAAIPDSVLYGAQREAFVERYGKFELLTEALNYNLQAINNNYYFTVQEAAWAIKNDIDNITDMELLDSMMTVMDNAEIMLEKAYLAFDEYTAIRDLFWDAADHSKAISQEVADARDMALENSNYVGYTVSSIEAIEDATEDIKASYLAYVFNAVPADGYLFDVTFLMASVDCASKDGWTTNGTVGTNANQHWSGEANTYLEPCDWGATGWDASISQTLNLPNGVYTVKAAGRASAGVTLTLQANDSIATIPSVGDVGGTIATDGTVWADVATGVAAGKTFANNNAGRGWNYVYVTTEVVDSSLTITARGVTTEVHQWSSVDDFQLMFHGAVVPVVEVATVTLDKTEATLTKAGETVQLTATIAPENADDKTITWTTSDEKVATVDAKGVVTAVANGTATITATAANGVSATCVVTVNIVDGIEAIEAVDNAVIYTITGKVVNGDVKTLEKGIYIVNGKKIMVK